MFNFDTRVGIAVKLSPSSPQRGVWFRRHDIPIDLTATLVQGAQLLGNVLVSFVMSLVD